VNVVFPARDASDAPDVPSTISFFTNIFDFAFAACALAGFLESYAASAISAAQCFHTSL
jgi:hypothetical protein